MKNSKEIWDSLERVRGIFHQNDKPDYLERFQRALDEAFAQGRVQGLEQLKEHLIKEGACSVFVYDEINDFIRGTLADTRSQADDNKLVGDE